MRKGSGRCARAWLSVAEVEVACQQTSLECYRLPFMDQLARSLLCSTAPFRALAHYLSQGNEPARPPPHTVHLQVVENDNPRESAPRLMAFAQDMLRASRQV